MHACVLAGAGGRGEAAVYALLLWSYSSNKAALPLLRDIVRAVNPLAGDYMSHGINIALQSRHCSQRSGSGAPPFVFRTCSGWPLLNCAEGDRHACCPVRSYKSTLEKYINPDDIPSCYGGRAVMEWPAHEQPNRVYR